MLKITIPAMELYDSINNEFIEFKEQTISLEHSLVSIAKWEAKWHKPFLSQRDKDEKTIEEISDYIRCMTLTQNVDPRLYRFLPDRIINQITSYIEDPMTATEFSGKNPPKVKTFTTNEEIYYLMISLNIPIEFQKWHINRLMTLIRVCQEKNGSGKKMSSNEIYKMNRSLNAARKAKLHTKG